MVPAGHLDFFAAESDQRAVLDFLFTSTDVRVFESYSQLGAELREFHSTNDLASAFSIGIDSHVTGRAILLRLWSPSITRELTIERVALDPAACRGHSFRYRIGGGFLMQLYLGGICGKVITKSHFGHVSELQMKKWGCESDVDWEALKVISNRIQYHVRKRLAVGKVPGRPILAQAMDLAKAGYALKETIRCPWQYELPSQVEGG